MHAGTGRRGIDVLCQTVVDDLPLAVHRAQRHLPRDGSHEELSRHHGRLAVPGPHGGTAMVDTMPVKGNVWAATRNIPTYVCPSNPFGDSQHERSGRLRRHRLLCHRVHRHRSRPGQSNLRRPQQGHSHGMAL